MGLTVVDASVIIAVLDGGDANHNAAREALAAARQRGDRLVVPASADAEVLVAPLRTDPAQGDLVDDFLEALPATVEPASRETARRAAGLRALHGSRVRLPDALVIATAALRGADRVVTTDAGWPDIGVLVDVV